MSESIFSHVVVLILTRLAILAIFSFSSVFIALNGHSLLKSNNGGWIHLRGANYLIGDPFGSSLVYMKATGKSQIVSFVK